MNSQVAVEEGYDFDRTVYSSDEYAGKKFLDSVYEAARVIPKNLFMDESLRAYDPIVELAYKLYLDEGEIN